MLRKLTADQQRSVRHWTMEFVVVLVGVLLALWFQQWGERRRAVADMRAAEAAIHDEVKEALKSLIWREAISKCHRERAELLQSMLLNSTMKWQGLNENALIAVKGTLPASVAQSVYQRPVDTFTDAAWASALATGALAPMDRERFSRMVGIYDQIQYLRRTRELEDDAASRLSPLGFPMQLTPELRAEMLRGVYDVDRARFTFELISADELATSMKQLGWDDKAEIGRWMVEDEREAKRRGITFRPCVARQKNPFKADGPNG